MSMLERGYDTIIRLAPPGLTPDLHVFDVNASVTMFHRRETNTEWLICNDFTTFLLPFPMVWLEFQIEQLADDEIVRRFREKSGLVSVGALSWTVALGGEWALRWQEYFDNTLFGDTADILARGGYHIAATPESEQIVAAKVSYAKQMQSFGVSPLYRSFWILFSESATQIAPLLAVSSFLMHDGRAMPVPQVFVPLRENFPVSLGMATLLPFFYSLNGLMMERFRGVRFFADAAELLIPGDGEGSPRQIRRGYFRADTDLATRVYVPPATVGSA